MENVVHYNNESHIAQGTPYITIPFNITLGSGEIARGFFIKEDDSASTQAVLNKITDVKLAYSGWNEARSTDNAKIAASSLTAEEFFGTSNTAFIVNLSTKDLTPAASPYKLGFTIDTAWSSKTLETAAVNDWKNAECKAAFTFIIEGQKTIRYDANGGTGSMETQTCAFNGTVALSKNNFTRTGYDFIHWNTKPDGTGTSYSDEAALTVYTDTTLYAQWALIGKSSIYGTITNASKDAPVTLTLTKTGETGSRTETVPAGNTSYTIKNVEPGIYNLKAENTHDGFTYEIVYLVEVKAGIPTECNIIFPLQKVKTIVNISTAGNTPNLAVGKLSEEVEKEVEAHPEASGNITTLLFSAEAHLAEEIPDDSAKIQAEIKKAHPDAETGNIFYLNATLDLLIKDSSGITIRQISITDAKTVLEICLPYDFSGKTAVYVYRLHNGNAEQLTQLSAKPSAPVDKTYYLDRANSVIRVYADKYSVYSVAYIREKPAPSHSSGRNDGYSVWLTSTPTAAPTAAPTAYPTPVSGDIIEPVPHQNDEGYLPLIIAAAIAAGLGVITALVIIISRRKQDNNDTDEKK